MINVETFKKAWSCDIAYVISHSGRPYVSDSYSLTYEETDKQVSGVHPSDVAGFHNRSASFPGDRSQAERFGDAVRKEIVDIVPILTEKFWTDQAGKHMNEDSPWPVRLEAAGVYLSREREPTEDGKVLIRDLIQQAARSGYLDKLTFDIANPISMPTFERTAKGQAAAFQQPVGGAAAPAASQGNGSSKTAGARHFAGQLELVRQNVCIIKTPAAGHGSGFVVAPARLVVTNAHVVGDYEDIIVSFSDGSEVAGIVVARDLERDLALVRTSPPSAVTGIRVKPTRDVMIGEEAYVVGAPLDETLGWTLTRGIVSQVRGGATSHIQTDAAMSPGNSGGPLADKQGLVLGVVVSKRVDEAAEGVGFAVAGDEVLEFVSQNSRR